MYIMKNYGILFILMVFLSGCYASSQKPVVVYEAPKAKYSIFNYEEEPAVYNPDAADSAGQRYDNTKVVEVQPTEPVIINSDGEVYDRPADVAYVDRESVNSEEYEPLIPDKTYDDYVVDAQQAPMQYSAGAYPAKTGKPYVIKGITYYPLESVDEGYVEVGIASWYGNDFHGKKTSNGEIYDMYAMTAAHKTLPMPTFVRVENLDNGLETVVRVNDRGPFSKGRIIDLSYAAAKDIDMIKSGTARVRITVLSQSQDHLRTENVDKDMNNGRFAVQIAAFSVEENARRLAASYDNAVVQTVHVNGNTFYRVQLKGYASKDSAEFAADSLSDTYPGAFVVAE